MKKLFLLMFAGMAGIWSASAQDIIVKKNGEELQVKVEEVGEQSVRYRKFSNLGGPIYSISRDEIFIIRYESGDRDVISSLETPASESADTPVLPTRVDVERAVVMAKEAERKKMTEFGLQTEIGLSFWSFKSYFEDGLSQYGDVARYTNNPQMRFAVSAFVEHFFKKTGEGHVGAGIGYMHDASWTSIVAKDGNGSFDFRMKYDALFASVYYGWRPVRNGFYLQGGFRFAYVVSLQGKIGVEGSYFESAWGQIMGDDFERDAWIKSGSDITRSFIVCPYLDAGYSFGHVDLGLQYQFAVASPNKEAGNKPSSLGFTLKYRF